MKQLGLTVYKPNMAYKGYTLFCPLSGASAYLVDMQGNVVHRWEMPYLNASYGYLLENGHILFGGRTGRGPAGLGDMGGIVIEVDWDGNTSWEYVEDTLHHDFCRMKNGNTMLLGWEQVPTDVAKRIKGGKPGTEHESGVWCDYFREVTPDGRVAWEWHAYEHLDPETDYICPLHSREEWTHAKYLRGLARWEPADQFPVAGHRGNHRQEQRGFYLEMG